ncbi:(2Fe-2S)-binding protein [Falsiruegeria mediterranea]|jgi:isoquinoline 1-oxidoreductase subunit alpha|uniref:Isoquinoline 1-oxidoreductase subunit alpha n=1 Tax=Falsiruegeria mediterranea M17 TaxID=1200281 RepID=A0A2R8C2R3_9RHOB|nr:(2Fe-2S)-binding protein [Falsiruegeria mediterranea]SPJ26714.1 Isoquinoline 1-oxidoreductase subunit alpha [Falsiruegeria mediterranea M17]
MTLNLKLNGQTHQVEAEPGTPLLWVIRDELKLTGTKFGCGVASCGACTVHLDGEPVRSCQTFIEDVEDAEVTTIEVVDQNSVGAAVQAAWAELDVVQCGYCQSGQIMSAIGLLTENSKPTLEEIDDYMSGNACRCATYQRIRAAIVLASEKLEA